MTLLTQAEDQKLTGIREMINMVSVWPAGAKMLKQHTWRRKKTPAGISPHCSISGYRKVSLLKKQNWKIALFNPRGSQGQPFLACNFRQLIGGGCCHLGLGQLPAGCPHSSCCLPVHLLLIIALLLLFLNLKRKCGTERKRRQEESGDNLAHSFPFLAQECRKEKGNGTYGSNREQQQEWVFFRSCLLPRKACSSIWHSDAARTWLGCRS